MSVIRNLYLKMCDIKWSSKKHICICSRCKSVIVSKYDKSPERNGWYRLSPNEYICNKCYDSICCSDMIDELMEYDDKIDHQDEIDSLLYAQKYLELSEKLNNIKEMLDRPISIKTDKDTHEHHCSCGGCNCNQKDDIINVLTAIYQCIKLERGEDRNGNTIYYVLICGKKMRINIHDFYYLEELMYEYKYVSSKEYNNENSIQN